MAPLSTFRCSCGKGEFSPAGCVGEECRSLTSLSFCHIYRPSACVRCLASEKKTKALCSLGAVLRNRVSASCTECYSIFCHPPWEIKLSHGASANSSSRVDLPRIPARNLVLAWNVLTCSWEHNQRKEGKGRLCHHVSWLIIKQISVHPRSFVYQYTQVLCFAYVQNIPLLVMVSLLSYLSCFLIMFHGLPSSFIKFSIFPKFSSLFIMLHHVYPLLVINHITLPDQQRRGKHIF